MNNTLTDEQRRERAHGVLDQAQKFLLGHDMAAFAGLWASDGVIEFPFASPGYPQRVEGRDAVTEYLSGYTEILDVRSIVAETRHQSDDPDTVIVEFEVDGVAVASKNPYRMRYISVVTVHADGIALYRDYWSPMAAAAALGASADGLHATFTGADK